MARLLDVCGEEARLVNSHEVAASSADEQEASSSEIRALKAQMRTLRNVAVGSLALSAAVLVAVGAIAVQVMAPQQVHGRSVASGHLEVQQLFEDRHEDAVIVPYGFKACDSSQMPPQVAPIRKTGDFLFLSGILGYDVPCKSAVKDVSKQIQAAFKWANQTLRAAGAEWEDVLTVTSYHVDLYNREHDDVFVREREKVLPKPPYPAWTAIGVKSLYFTGEVFEMSIIARRKPCEGLECDDVIR